MCGNDGFCSIQTNSESNNFVFFSNIKRVDYSVISGDCFADVLSKICDYIDIFGGIVSCVCLCVVFVS